MALEVQALTGRRFAAPIDFAAHIQRAARDLVRAAVGLGRNPIPEDLWPILATHASETLPPGTENALEAARPVTVIELEVAAGEDTPETVRGVQGPGLVPTRMAGAARPQRRGLHRYWLQGSVHGADLAGRLFGPGRSIERRV